MKKRNIDYSVNDILYFYGDIIEELIIDGRINGKMEAVALIGDILSCGVSIYERGMIIGLLLKIKEIKSNTTIKDQDMTEYKGKDNTEIIEALIDRKYPNRKNGNLHQYSEEYIYDNDDRYEIPKSRKLKRDM